MLVTRPRGKVANSVVTKTLSIVKLAFEVVSSAAEFDEVDGVGVVLHNFIVVRPERVDVKSDVLVKVDLVWGDVEQLGRVAHLIVHPTFVVLAVVAGHERVVGVVLGLDLEPDRLVAVVCNEVIIEGLHWDTAEKIRQRWHRVGKFAETRCRLNLIVD